jgi:hypothetical protein
MEVARSDESTEGADNDLAPIEDPLAGEDRGALEAAAATSGELEAASTTTADGGAQTADGDDAGEVVMRSRAVSRVAIPTDAFVLDGTQSPAPATADEGTATSPDPKGTFCCFNCISIALPACVLLVLHSVQEES